MRVGARVRGRLERKSDALTYMLVDMHIRAKWESSYRVFHIRLLSDR